MDKTERYIISGIATIIIVTAWIIITALVSYVPHTPYVAPCRAPGHVEIPCD
jgi:hypothetical protein